MSLPDAAAALEVTGYQRGTITPFGSLTACPVVADVRLRHVATRSFPSGLVQSEYEVVRA